MDVNKLFDLENIDDIPTATAKVILQKKRQTVSEVLKVLFELKNTLSIDEILVGFYRLKKKELSYSSAYSSVLVLTKNKFIEKIDSRIYRKL